MRIYSMTLSEQIVNKLILLGWTETASRSSKYRTFIKNCETDRVYVGKRGALRKGRSVTESYSYNVKRFLFNDTVAKLIF